MLYPIFAELMKLSLVFGTTHSQFQEVLISQCLHIRVECIQGLCIAALFFTRAT